MASVSAGMMPHIRVKNYAKPFVPKTKVTQRGRIETPADKCNECNGDDFTPTIRLGSRPGGDWVGLSALSALTTHSQYFPSVAQQHPRKRNVPRCSGTGCAG